MTRGASYVLVLLSVSSRVCALGGVGWSLMGDILSVGRVLLGAALLGLLVVAGGRASCRRAAPADAAPLLLLFAFVFRLAPSAPLALVMPHAITVAPALPLFVVFAIDSLTYSHHRLHILLANNLYNNNSYYCILSFSCTAAPPSMRRTLRIFPYYFLCLRLSTR